jgi:hypothetical protein
VTAQVNAHMLIQCNDCVRFLLDPLRSLKQCINLLGLISEFTLNNSKTKINVPLLALSKDRVRLLLEVISKFHPRPHSYVVPKHGISHSICQALLNRLDPLQMRSGKCLLKKMKFDFLRADHNCKIKRNSISDPNI